jgi:hypothetical protein
MATGAYGDIWRAFYMFPGGGCLSIPIPGAVESEAHGVNDDDQVVGSYLDSQNQNHAFIYDIHTGQLQTINYQGAASTWFRGINGFGQIVGGYENSRGEAVAFVYDHGNFTSLSTKACSRQPDHDPTGINNNEFVALDCYSYDAVYDYAHSAVVTTISYPAGGVLRFPGISANGLVAGSTQDANGVPVGFFAPLVPQE